MEIVQEESEVNDLDFFEIEGKKIMGQYGIPVDDEILYSQTERLHEITYPCVVKAQVLTGKRGKAGGILFAKNPGQMEEAVEKIKKLSIYGQTPTDILIAPQLEIKQEHYLGLTLDRTRKEVLLLYSPYGGMDIEELAEEAPEKIAKLCISNTLNVDVWEKYTQKFCLPEKESGEIYAIASKLISMFYSVDAMTLEINPLVKTKDNRFVAADAKLVVDDNSLYRQKDLAFLPRMKKENAREEYACEHNLAYVELEKHGAIGVIAGGAGIGMATVDSVKYYGKNPYNFLDLGGGVTAEKTYYALDMLLRIPEIEGILVNVFGGINNCLTMAEGIVKAYREALQRGTDKKLVVKSRGFNQEDGWSLYNELNIPQIRYGTTDDAVKKLIALLDGKGEGV